LFTWGVYTTPVLSAVMQDFFGASSNCFQYFTTIKCTTYVHNLINHVGGKMKWQLLTGVSIFCWTLWLSRNNVVFDKTHPAKSFMHVLYWGTHTDAASGFNWKVMSRTRRRSPWCAKSLRWWPCRFLPTMDEDGGIDFMLKISSFVIGSSWKI
jgi:hypothetical protein